jgi:hypothetical protein
MALMAQPVLIVCLVVMVRAALVAVVFILEGT